MAHHTADNEHTICPCLIRQSRSCGQGHSLWSWNALTRRWVGFPWEQRASTNFISSIMAWIRVPDTQYTLQSRDSRQKMSQCYLSLLIIVGKTKHWWFYCLSLSFLFYNLVSTHLYSFPVCRGWWSTDSSWEQQPRKQNQGSLPILHVHGSEGYLGTFDHLVSVIILGWNHTDCKNYL